MLDNTVYTSELWRSLFFIVTSAFGPVVLVLGNIIIRFFKEYRKNAIDEIEKYTNNLNIKLDGIEQRLKIIEEKTKSTSDILEYLDKLKGSGEIFKNIHSNSVSGGYD